MVERYRHDYIMTRLLNACVSILSERGMRRLFVDAVRRGDEGFSSTGTASYGAIFQVLPADVGLQGSKNGRVTETYGAKRRFADVAGASCLTAEIA